MRWRTLLEDVALLEGPGASGALLALLICGHTLGDFAFQTREMVRRKREFKVLSLHILVLTFVHALVLLPFFPSWQVAVAIIVVGLSHMLIDHVRTWVEHQESPRPGWDIRLFVLDQAMHLAILLGVWWVLVPDAAGWFDPVLMDASIPVVLETALLVAAGAFLWNGGNAIVRGTLDVVELRYRSTSSTGADAHVEDGDRVGELIGKLERLFIFVLALIGAWAVIGLYVGTKPFARLKIGGDDQGTSALKLNRDYYLVGTLTSALVVILVVAVVWTLV